MFFLQPADFTWVRREAQRFVRDFPSYAAELGDLQQIAYVVLLQMARRFQGNNQYFRSLVNIRLQGAFRNHIAWLTDRKHSRRRPARAFIEDLPHIKAGLYGTSH